MRRDDALVHRLELGPGRFDSGTRRQPTEDFGHAVLAAGDHRGRQVVRAGDDVRNHLGFRRVGDRRLQNADDRGRARAETDGPADHRRIALERRHPEAVREHDGSSRVRAIIAGVDEASQYRTQSHHIEIRAADDAGPDLVRLAQSDHRERDHGEIANSRDRFEPGAELLNLRHRKRGVLDPDSRCALADVDEAVLVAVDERPQQHAADDAEDRRIRADAERERQDDGQREPFGAQKRTQSEFEIGKKGHRDLRVCL